MSILHTLAEHFFYTNRRTYSNKQGNVAYLDGAPLNRPLSLPRAHRVFVLLIVAAAIIAGALFLNATILSSMREAAATEQAITDNLAREASIESLPKMQDYIALNDVGLMEAFEKAGYTMYDASANSEQDEFVAYKIPSDMSLDEAAALYERGISALSAPEATKLLNGSWQFVAERSGITSMVVRYADFSTGDPQIAVQNALQKMGFDADEISDSGVDESGNTYNVGTLETKKGTYTWKISALPLSEMFSINNMPEEACYVGVRLTVQ